MAPILVCADGAANAAVDAGLLPDAVIGDLDSISSRTLAALASDTIHQIADQSSTDFEKCLSAIDTPAIVAHGFLGGLLDHQLAVLNALVKFPDQTCLLVGPSEVCFLCPNQINLDLPKGTRLSLFPLGEVTGKSSGLAYPIDGLEFSPMSQIGTSNEVTGPVQLEFDARAMLVILPLDHREAVWAALIA